MEQEASKEICSRLAYQVADVLLSILWLLNVHQEGVLVEPVVGERLIFVVLFQVEVFCNPDRVQVNFLVDVIFDNLLILLTFGLGAALPEDRLSIAAT